MGEDHAYELDGAPPPSRPLLPGGVVMRPEADQVIDALLADLFVHARNCIRVFGDFQLAIAFWPQVTPVVRRLMCDLNFRDFPWARTRVWSIDEIDVPPDDPRHRGELLRGLIVSAADMPPEQAHAFDFSQPDPTLHFDAMLKEHLGWREKGQDRLDFVLVPQLPDGAWGGVLESPDSASLTVQVAPKGHAPAMLAMSGRLIRASRFVAILATGPDARSGLQHWTSKFSVRPDGVLAMEDSAEVRWYVDHDACPTSCE